MANLAEVALIAAIWLRAAGEAIDATDAAFQGFSLVTQLALPSTSSGWAKIAVVLAESTALLLLLGGIAAVIALVPAKLKVSGEHKSYSKWEELFAERRRSRKH